MSLDGGGSQIFVPFYDVSLASLAVADASWSWDYGGDPEFCKKQSGVVLLQISVFAQAPRWAVE
jgi:hypothetical protein